MSKTKCKIWNQDTVEFESPCYLTSHINCASHFLKFRCLVCKKRVIAVILCITYILGLFCESDDIRVRKVLGD